MPPSSLNTSIEELNKATAALGKERGVDLSKISTIPVSVAEQEVAPLEIPQIQIDDAPLGRAAASSKAFVASRQAALDQEAQKADSDEQGIRDLFDFLGNQSADREALFESKGVNASTRDLNELTARISTFADDILNRDKDAVDTSIIERQDAAQRGVSSHFLEGGQQANLAKRGIQRRAEASELSALNASAQMLQGNLEAAKDEIERSLSATYDPVKEAIEQEKFFIQRQYKQLDKADQRLADAQTVLLDQQLSEINRAESLVAGMLPFATPEEVARITSIQSPQKQIQAATQVIARGQASDRNLDRAVRGQQFRAAQATADAKEYDLILKEQSVAEREQAVREGRLLPEQAEVVDKIDKEFRSEPIVKEYTTAVSKRFATEEILANGVKGVGDMFVVYEFMKSVDPTSVVRESEFDNAASTGNIFAGQYTKFNEGYFGEGGFLPEEVKKSFIDAMDASFEGKQTQYFSLKDQFGNKIDRRIGTQGGDVYLTAYEEGAPANAAASQNPDTAKPGDIIETDGVRYRVLTDGNLMEI